jgi:hypothetical protein
MARLIFELETLCDATSYFGSLIRLIERLPESGSLGPACDPMGAEGALGPTVAYYHAVVNIPTGVVEIVIVVIVTIG